MEIDYRSNLLGSIKAHLASLQGYDTMALELIQNADDAKALEISFDITEHSLILENSESFSYCGNLDSSHDCLHEVSRGKKCDFHSIIEIASGEKAKNPENIGRFGIGFVSCYQICDKPTLESNGLRLEFDPLTSKINKTSSDLISGTRFIFPWAKDPKSKTRIKLGETIFSDDDQVRVRNDIKNVLSKSLLFLKNVRVGTLKENGREIFKCVISRDSDQTLVTYLPKNVSEKWHIIESSISIFEEEKIYKSFPEIEKDKRNKKVFVSLNLQDDYDKEGLIYAFLPTQESTFLPININADFYPESSRKKVIWEGKGKKDWNELLIRTAADSLVNDLAKIERLVGQNNFWKLITKSKELFENNREGKWYDAFWNKMYEKVPNSLILKGEKADLLRPSESFFYPKWAKPEHINLFNELGILIANKEISDQYGEVLNKLHCQQLVLDTFIDRLCAFEDFIPPEDEQVSEKYLNRLVIIWEILEYLITSDEEAEELLKKAPIFLNHKDQISYIHSLLNLPPGIERREIIQFLPKLNLVSAKLDGFSKLARFFMKLNVGKLASHLEANFNDNQQVEGILPIKSRDGLRFLYSAIAKLYETEASNINPYELSHLAIWQMGDKFVTPEYVILPGDFSDPIRGNELFDETLFIDEKARRFAIEVLGIRVQDIKEYVTSILPKYFEEQKINNDNYAELIEVLASKTELQDDEESLDNLKVLPLAPTQDGGWEKCCEVYDKNETLALILGDDNRAFWLDSKRVPKLNSVRNLIENLGLLTEASPVHLLDRLRLIAQSTNEPNEEQIKDLITVFDYLQEKLEEWEKNDPNFGQFLLSIKNIKCFPSDNIINGWYKSEDLFPRNHEDLIGSQEKVLSFELSVKTCQKLGLQTEIPTQTIIDHLKNLSKKNIACSYKVYGVLNKRAEKDSWLLSNELSKHKCIYISNDSESKYHKPRWVFSKEVKLGNYAISISESFGNYKNFYQAIGVREEPTQKDFVDIILRISEEWEEFQKFKNKEAKSVFKECLKQLSALKKEEFSQDTIESLRGGASLINRLEEFQYPGDLLFNDSAWHADYFESEALDSLLVRTKGSYNYFLKALGVKKISENTRIEIDYISEKEEKIEKERVRQIRERYHLFQRIFKNHETEWLTLSECLKTLTAASYPKVTTTALISIEGRQIKSEPKDTFAFYDIESGKLLLTREKENQFSWVSIFKSFISQILYNIDSDKIRDWVTALHAVMTNSTQDGEQFLTELGYPELETDDIDEDVDISSPQLGTSTDESPNTDGDNSSQSDQDSSKTKETASSNNKKGTSLGKPTKGSNTQPSRKSSEQSSPEGENGEEEDSENESPSAPNSQNSHTDRTANNHMGNGPNSRDNQGKGNSNLNSKKQKKGKNRTKGKNKRRNRMRSYVLNNAKEMLEGKVEGSNEYQQTIEKISSEIVAEYEIKQGREIDELYGNNPGYDLESYDPQTKKTSYIEVKGTNGKLGTTGVSVSKTQFLTAQHHGSDYWLYIVEHVGTGKEKIYRIKNPAFKVTDFMFDQNWLKIAEPDESIDSRKEFSIGRKIRHANWGVGKIIKCESRGSAKVIHVQFKGELYPRPISLNASGNSPIQLLED